MTKKILTSIHGRKVGLSQNADLIVGSKQAVVVNDGGAIFGKQGAPTAVNTTATLTIAELLTGIITSTTAAAVTGTLPTGTLTAAGVDIEVGDSFEWSVINTGGTNAFTVAAGTDHTLVGSGAVAANSSQQFRTRKTAATTFITYRV